MQRTISSSNLDQVERVKQRIIDDRKDAPAPNAVPYFDVFTAFSFIVPLSELDREPRAIRDTVLEGVLDQGMQKKLEEEKIINWERSCMYLSCLKTLGDSNCLMHSASLAMWGIHDRDLILRSAVFSAFTHSKSRALFDRWQSDHRSELRQLDASMDPHVWNAEYQQIVDMVNPRKPGGRMDSLTDFHIFVLCNVLRRPIIVYGTARVHSIFTGASFGPNNIPGVYLPLLWTTDCILKDPLMLAYVSSHFSALVPCDKHHGNIPPAVPLCDQHGHILPVKFLLPNEVSAEDTYKKAYMCVSTIRHSSGSIPVAQLNIRDQPEILRQFWRSHVEMCKKNIGCKDTKQANSEKSTGMSSLVKVISLKEKESLYQKLSLKGQIYFFVGTVSDDHICPICQDLLNEPQLTICGHLFCNECLKKAGSYQKVSSKSQLECPLCRTVSPQGAFPDARTNRQIQNLNVICSNSSCTWKGSLCDLPNHRNGTSGKACLLEPVTCPNDCQTANILRKELDDHQKKECPMRKEPCPHCKVELQFCKMADHFQSSCQEYPIQCPNECGQKSIPVKNIEVHLHECPEAKVPCPHLSTGCTETMPRKYLQKHVEEAKDHHLKLSFNHIGHLTDIVACMYSWIEKHNTEAKPIVPESSLALGSILHRTERHCRPWLCNKSTFPSLPWIIQVDHYTQKKDAAACWTSPVFYTHPVGYKLCLRVYAAGNTKGAKEYVSVTLEQLKGPNDELLPPWPSQKGIRLILLNQADDSGHYAGCWIPDDKKIQESQSLEQQYPRRYFSHSKIQNIADDKCLFLKDDCLFFSVMLGSVSVCIRPNCYNFCNGKIQSYCSDNCEKISRLCGTSGCSNFRSEKQDNLYCDACMHKQVLLHWYGQIVPKKHQCKDPTCRRKKAPFRMGYCDNCYEKRYLVGDQ